MCLSCPYRSSPSLQEVLDLGDGASTDSGWGESASSSSEEKSSGRERDADNDNDGGERSTSSDGKLDASPVVSGSELAVFLFQGGVKGSEEKVGDEPPAVARGGAIKIKGAQSPVLLTSSEDAFFEYSGSGCEGSSGRPHGDLRTGELDSSSTAGKVTARESGHPAVTDGEDAAAIDGVDSSDRREEGAERGTKSFSLTGELRGVGFVDVPVLTSSKGAANESSL